MKTKIAINGFGRIGRIALRLALSRYLGDFEVVAINTSGSMPIEGWAHLFEFDTIYGRFGQSVEVLAGQQDEIGRLKIGKLVIPVLAQREPKLLPWDRYQPQVVIEATGVFADKKGASLHLEAGAKKVVVSAATDEVQDYVIGVNEDKYKGALIVGNASCTTNCVTPIVKVIKDNFGLQKAMMTTVHAYTSTQSLTDDSHKDLRRARAAAQNLIPTSTGAAKTTAEAIPEVKGLFDGLAIRAPILCGSIADVTLLTLKRTSVNQINEAFTKAANGPLKGVLAVTTKPLVSSDILGMTESAIVDLNLTRVVDGDLVKVIAWYDNEWGYCCRLLELTSFIANKKK
jgi:glyceraldehyde 3-phosphate dehydrogenase